MVVAIINSCDGLVHAIAKYCNKISSKQTIVLVTLSSTYCSNKCLANPSDLLSTMNENDKEREIKCTRKYAS